MVRGITAAAEASVSVSVVAGRRVTFSRWWWPEVAVGGGGGGEGGEGEGNSRLLAKCC